jgi:hypothetical protein
VSFGLHSTDSNCCTLSHYPNWRTLDFLACNCQLCAPSDVLRLFPIPRAVRRIKLLYSMGEECQRHVLGILDVDVLCDPAPTLAIRAANRFQRVPAAWSIAPSEHSRPVASQCLRNAIKALSSFDALSCFARHFEPWFVRKSLQYSLERLLLRDNAYNRETTCTSATRAMAPEVSTPRRKEKGNHSCQ